MAVRRRALIERICRTLCEIHALSADELHEGKPMWEIYRDQAERIMDGSGIRALVGVVRNAADDRATPERVRQELKGALEAFGA
jgi:hypothetical protein